MGGLGRVLTSRRTRVLIRALWRGRWGQWLEEIWSSGTDGVCGVSGCLGEQNNNTTKTLPRLNDNTCGSLRLTLEVTLF